MDFSGNRTEREMVYITQVVLTNDLNRALLSHYLQFTHPE